MSLSAITPVLSLPELDEHETRYAKLQLELDHRERVTKVPFFRRTVHSFLRRKTPRRFKRLIFLSSVVGMVRDINNPEKEVIEKLNRLMNLAHNQDAVAFPMHIHSWIWKKRLNDPCIEINGEPVPLCRLKEMNFQHDDYRKISEYFVLRAPSWLIYGSVMLIAHDLEHLFKNLNTLHS